MGAGRGQGSKLLLRAVALRLWSDYIIVGLYKWAGVKN